MQDNQILAKNGTIAIDNTIFKGAVYVKNYSWRWCGLCMDATEMLDSQEYLKLKSMAM